MNTLTTAAQAAGAAGVMAATNPKAAAIVALAPLVVQFLDSATKLQQAGVIPPEQLAALFASIGQGVQKTHDEWAAMDAAGVK
jgi:hypothetical protein